MLKGQCDLKCSLEQSLGSRRRSKKVKSEDVLILLRKNLSSIRDLERTAGDKGERVSLRRDAAVCRRG